MKEQNQIRIGHPAVDFSLPDTSKNLWKLGESPERVVALLFYPADETLVCTKQLCSVRDNWSKYIDTGADIVGISPGTEEQHGQFADRHRLPMPLLADPDRSITSLYAKHWWMPIWATRAVVVIDAKGIVRYRNILVRALRPSDDEVLAAIHLAKYDLLAGSRVASVSG